MAEKKIVINNMHMSFPSAGEGYNENRQRYYETPGLYECEASIQVIGFNRLEEKTKLCVDSILRYTKGIDYQLILVDSGSEDETTSYFESVPFENKVVVRIEKNLGSGYAGRIGWQYATGRYRVFVANDCIVTTNWLTNLLTCIRSNPKIGMVVPATSHTSNNQAIDIGSFTTWDEMQALAAKHNVSNLMLWEERPRLVNPISLVRPEMLDMVEAFDPGFRHDFGEDNFARCVHRAGYRMVLCKDTYVEHNHPDNERDMANWQKSLEAGREEYREKYHGLDPWDDINNYISDYLGDMDLSGFTGGEIRVLGVDIRCGTPFLDIRNRLRQVGFSDSELSLFACTSDVRYVTDLMAYPAEVQAGGIRSIEGLYPDESMDIVVTTEPVPDTGSVSQLFRLVKKNGYLLFPVRNRRNILALIDQFLGTSETDTVYDESEILTVLDEGGAKQVWVSEEVYQDRLRESVQGMLWDTLPAEVSEEIERRKAAGESLYTEKFWYLVKK